MKKIHLLLFLWLFLPFGAWANVQVPTRNYVDQRMETTVTVTGEQEISGKKVYIESPIVPTPALP